MSFQQLNIAMPKPSNTETHAEHWVIYKGLWLVISHTMHMSVTLQRAFLTHKTHVQMPHVCSIGRNKCMYTEVGMLPRISRKRSIRSRFYWFTEFCNSQCLSHFAAPFIVDRAETSVAENCCSLFDINDRDVKRQENELLAWHQMQDQAYASPDLMPSKLRCRVQLTN